MNLLRHATLIGVPLAFSVLLWFHPMIGDYEGLRDVTTRFQVVHVGMVISLPLLAIAIYTMLDGLSGRAAAVGRFALIPFVVFYVPYVAFEGIALGVLGDRLNDLPADQRDAIAPGMVQDFASNPIFGEPGLFWALGSIALIVVMVSTVLAYRRAGARAGASGHARRLGADRRSRPAARLDRLGLLRRSGLAGAAGATEPVLEPRLPELGVLAREQAGVARRGAEVARVGVDDHMARVVAQGLADELVERDRLGACDLDDSVHGRAHGGRAHGAGDVFGRDRPGCAPAAGERCRPRWPRRRSSRRTRRTASSGRSSTGSTRP